MFFNKKYIKVNHNEEPEKTQAEEPKQEGKANSTCCRDRYL